MDPKTSRQSRHQLIPTNHHQYPEFESLVSRILALHWPVVKSQFRRLWRKYRTQASLVEACCYQLASIVLPGHSLEQEMFTAWPK
jgi:hypothetical protein